MGRTKIKATKNREGIPQADIIRALFPTLGCEMEASEVIDRACLTSRGALRFVLWRIRRDKKEKGQKINIRLFNGRCVRQRMPR
jgi:hypothetical protein